VGNADINCVEVGGLPVEVPPATLEAAPGAEVEEVVATVQVLNILKWTMLKL
jgi:hypothetical protein